MMIMGNSVNLVAIDKIKKATASSISFDDLGLVIVQQLSGIIPVERMNIGLINTEQYIFTDIFVTGTNIPCRPTGHSRSLSNTVVEASMDAGKPIVIGNESKNVLIQRFPGLKLTFDTGIQCILAAAVKSKCKFVGAMVLGSVQALAYSNVDLNMINDIGLILGERIANMENTVR